MGPKFLSPKIFGYKRFRFKKKFRLKIKCWVQKYLDLKKFCPKSIYPKKTKFDCHYHLVSLFFLFSIHSGIRNQNWWSACLMDHFLRVKLLRRMKLLSKLRSSWRNEKHPGVCYKQNNGRSWLVHNTVEERWTNADVKSNLKNL